MNLDMLETLVVFIGVVLVLALATQSLQELLKSIWPVKAQARLGMVTSLLQESTFASGLHLDDARALSEEVVRRLRGLGLKGVRGSAVRLDSLDVEQLAGLVEGTNPSFIPSLNATKTQKDEVPKELKDIADRVRSWYSIGMASVDARTTRRMRWFSLVTSAVVVVGLNVDALTLWERVGSSSARQQLIEDVEAVHAKLGEHLEAAGEDVTDDAAQVEELQKSREELEGLSEKLLADAHDGGVLANPGQHDWGNPDWWMGIALMTFLVSLGMPFWHETLGALLGLRKRLSGTASPKKEKKEEAEEPG